MIGFTLGVSILTGIAFGIVRTANLEALFEESLKEAVGVDARWRRNACVVLVVSEVALSLMLLVGAGCDQKFFLRLLKPIGLRHRARPRGGHRFVES